MKLEAGEVVSLLGPSGCGKTTLLKLASGIEKLQKGEIKLNDKIVSSFNFHLNSDKRQIGYVFQDCATNIATSNLQDRRTLTCQRITMHTNTLFDL